MEGILPGADLGEEAIGKGQRHKNAIGQDSINQRTTANYTSEDDDLTCCKGLESEHVKQYKKT